jgi:hypothetical protein
MFFIDWPDILPEAQLIKLSGKNMDESVTSKAKLANMCG